ncbi:probable serine/threonine-protein kinase mkcF [Procambarus clarkii]|uniref:probable serine/threonine-protein kinase mkcF n=1 Tax=Procambarus clarkii TaxID=6728 RepID=UPI0037428F94
MQPRTLVSSFQLNILMSQTQYIGQGAYAKVGRVPWDGGHAILKMMKRNSERDFRRELIIMERLDTAGGAPKILGLCYKPRAIVMSSRGEITLATALQHNLPDWYMVYIVLKVGQCLREVHERGVIHGDIHASNVMVTLSPDFCKPPEVFLIDFGMSGLSPEALSTFSPEDLACLGDTQMVHENLTYSHDVKCLGIMLLEISFLMKTSLASVRNIFEMATPSEREPAALDDVLQRLNTVLTDDFNINI